MINVGFLGCGNMGTAIMKGIYATGMTKDVSVFATSPSIIRLMAYDVDSAKLSELKDIGVIPCSSERELVEKCEYVFFAVKPQSLGSVLDKLSGTVTEDKVIISICAGIPEKTYTDKTTPNAKVILVMPNTPLLLGEGASALSRNSYVSDDEFEFVKNIFASCGKAAVVPSDKMKEVIAINGSSPAFIYLFAKGFVEYADSVGIDAECAKELFCQTLIGSARMITESGDSIDELIKKVSSPGGTTLKGLDEFYAANLTDTVKKACESCTRRAYELAE